MAFDEFQEVGHRRSWALEYRFSYTTFSHAVDIIPAARSDVTLTPTDIVPTDIVSRIVSVRG
jgi:hypothetical protein